MNYEYQILKVFLKKLHSMKNTLGFLKFLQLCPVLLWPLGLLLFSFGIGIGRYIGFLSADKKIELIWLGIDQNEKKVIAVVHCFYSNHLFFHNRIKSFTIITVACNWGCMFLLISFLRHDSPIQWWLQLLFIWVDITQIVKIWLFSYSWDSIWNSFIFICQLTYFCVDSERSAKINTNPLIPSLFL